MKTTTLENSTITKIEGANASKAQVSMIIEKQIEFAGGLDKFIKGEFTIIFNKK